MFYYSRAGLGNVATFYEMPRTATNAHDTNFSNALNTKTTDADGTFGFSLSAASNEREFIAVVNSNVRQAAIVERNAPSNWSSSNSRADFVIVTSGDLREQADGLAAIRKAQGLKTQVVLVDDLFDQFAFGKYDPQAVKDFLRTTASDCRFIC